MTTKTEQQTGPGNAPDVKYTLDDVGCYVDGARGIYAIDAIVEIAESHGWQGTNETRKLKGSLSDFEFAGEIEDHADSFMNSDYGVEGTYWGRNENGDWGLWEIDDYSQHSAN